MTQKILHIKVGSAFKALDQATILDLFNKFVADMTNSEVAVQSGLTSEIVDLNELMYLSPTSVMAILTIDTESE